MAVNNGCPECQQLTHGQPTNSRNVNDQEPESLYRTRPASPENGRASPSIFNPFYTGRPRTPANASRSNPIDRQQIIKRIKNGGSRPTSPELNQTCTVDNQDLIRRIKSGESRPTSPELERVSSLEYRKRGSRPTTPISRDSRPKSPEVQQDNQSVGLQIERPRSALHRGDFREKEQANSAFDRFDTRARDNSIPHLSTSPVVPWHPAFPSAALKPSENVQRPSLAPNAIPIPSRPIRERASSNASLAARFVYKPPTSPLVQSSRPDTPEPSRRDSRSPDKSRRHTFSPQALSNFQSDLDFPASARFPGKVGPPLRSEKTFPYQAHQPRRSLHYSPYSSLPQTPAAASRRPSLSTDSPLHHAPMVGSYEESILRGRMSTVPSRPLNFMAQIGVLGKGNCKSSLRCPPHVSVPFPAVFYSYGSGSKSPANDQPSPYVGLIDLENNLAHQEEPQDKRRQRVQGTFSSEGSRASSPAGIADDETALNAQTRRRRKQKAKRRSGSPRAPPGGSYRIPQQGQLQIVIKNPNKTAVKLFLVPYDLSDMEPGQKTFIRQRSYSAGPIIDMPLTSRKNFGTDRPEAAINATGDVTDKPMLRYLIHLHICCPSRGRFFLYKSVRVVFANRVPDGKEKLRNEIQLPEPRYSTYKPARDSQQGATPVTPRDNLKRRSTLEANGANDPPWPLSPYSFAHYLPYHEYGMHHQDSPLSNLPRHFTKSPTLGSRPSTRQLRDDVDMDCVSPGSQSRQSPISSEGRGVSRPVCQLDGPFDFQRHVSRERRTGARSESLLSRRLMDLAFRGQEPQSADSDEF